MPDAKGPTWRASWRVCLASGLTTLLVSGLASSAPEPEVEEKARAIVAVIGLDTYKQWPRLGNAVSDALGVRDLLISEFGFESPLEPLLDDDATKENILALVEDHLPKVVTENDSVVLFFGGHGHVRPVRVADRTIERGVLVPIAGHFGSEERSSDYIRVEDFLRAAAELPARHVLVVLDACRTGVALGPTIQRDRGADRYQHDLTERQSRMVIVSARANQAALDGAGPIPGHSLFTGTLIQGLRTGKADLDGDGLVTASELGLFVQSRVGRSTVSRQTPDFGRFRFDDRGEMVLSQLAPKSKAADIPGEVDSAELARIVNADAAVSAQFEANAPALALPTEALRAVMFRKGHVTDGYLGAANRGTLRLPTVQQTSRRLPRNAALVEFFGFQPHTTVAGRRVARGDPSYAAAVVRLGQQVQWVNLGERSEIDPLVDVWLKSLESRDGGDKRQPSRALSAALIEPLRLHLAGVDHLIIAPHGELTRIPFSALLGVDDRYLIERFVISYVSSGLELLELERQERSQLPAVVLGAPEYGEGSRFDYPPIPGASAEALAVAELLGIEPRLGVDANEAALKRAFRPSVLHIATNSAGSNRGPDPMLHAYLLLAGANSAAGTNLNDAGIFTALEMMDLDLRGTQLVVLSGCDTGLGEVSGGIVFGFRTALLDAGAESQVVSLWKIEDISTKELMVRFYRELLGGRGRAEALRSAQLQLLADKKYAHPYYWSSFILLGAWSPLDLPHPGSEQG